ncbi:MAG TPA: DUF424 family protein [Thermoplasmata archaeon]|jgi:uncharacterized protein|nr:DUF424 family protein [Thermoplasmata archaeon]
MSEDGFVMRVHRVRTEFVVAACDAELLGRELPVGEHGRTVTVSSHFYGERKVAREELLWALERATIANLLGARVLKLAEEAGHIAPGGAGSLGGVPHAEIFAMTH